MESNKNTEQNPEINGNPEITNFPKGDGNEKPEGDAPVNAELTPGQWLSQNGPFIAVVALLGALIYFNLGLGGFLVCAKVAVGLGLVIFVHELGHFLVAKWCDVHVQTFSIGFGPAIPGCSYRWGETLYKIGIIPLGGYVQMVGQVDGSEESDGSEDDPRSYRNKTVLQRMAIISAGVIMNAILAVICFVVVFEVPGKKRPAAVIGTVDSGAPAFEEGLPPGATIEMVGNIENPHFEDLIVSVMRWHGQDMPLSYKLPGKKEVTIGIAPEMNEKSGRPFIGISPPKRLELFDKLYGGRKWTAPTMYNSPARNPIKGTFEFDDEIIATSDPDNPKEVTELGEDPRKTDQKNYFEYLRRMDLLADQDVTIRVRRKDGSTEDITVAPAYHRTLGAVMAMGETTKIRKNSPGAKAGLQAKQENLDGDVIKQVVVRVPGHTTIFLGNPANPLDENAAFLSSATFLPPITVVPWLAQNELVTEKRLDPLRLPSELKQWARNLKMAEKKGKEIPEEFWKVKIRVKRQNIDPNGTDKKQFVNPDPELELDWDYSWEFADIYPMTMDSPWAIPELGIGYQVRTTVSHVDPKFLAEEESLKPGDVVSKIKFFWIKEKKDTEEVEDDVEEEHDLEPDQWAKVFATLQFSQLKKVVLTVNRAGEEEPVKLELFPEDSKDWPKSERGINLQGDYRIQKSKNFFDAVALGLRDTHNRVMEVFWSIRGLVTGSVSPKIMGGPVMIASVAYHYAGLDFWEFIYFLGIISINLAVINFLPIPVLDGGHMVFLLYEGVRGKPAPEKVRGWATTAGLLFLAGLMIFVIFMDISRFFF